MPHIVVVGSSNTDLVAQSPRFPKPGESVMGGVFARFQGGKGANQAVAAARAGARVTFVGRVGNDEFGKSALSGLAQEGIDLSFTETDTRAASGVAVILVDAGGENMIVVAEGANAALSRSQIDHALEAITSCDAVLCQLEMPLDTVGYLAETAENCGKMFVLNPAPAQAIPESFFGSIDVLTPNLGELETISGLPVETLDDIEKAAKSFLKKGVGAVVVTQGRDGCLVVTSQESWWTPALPVDARDTVGAGDCFSGNLTVALAEGKNLREAVRWATAAAGVSVTRLGAQTSMPSRQEIERAMGEFQS
jgi:ribokinase